MKIAIVLASLIAVLTGCAAGSPKYSCPAPEHGVCKSISEVYAGGYGEEGVFTPAHPHDDGSEATAAPKGRERGAAGLPFAGMKPGDPMRREARVMRVWIAPWVDAQGDWIDQSYLYTVLDRGGWQVEESLEAIGGQRKVEKKDTQDEVVLP